MREIRKFPKLDSKAIAKAFIAKELVSDKMRVCKKSDPDDMDNNNTEFFKTLIQQAYELPIKTLRKNVVWRTVFDKDTRHELSMQVFDIVTFLSYSYGESRDYVANIPVHKVIKFLKQHRKYQMVKTLRLIIQTIVTNEFDNHSDDPDDHEQHNERLREIERGH